MTTTTRGILIIVFGILSVPVFLVVGGFVSATNGSYLCTVFGITYAISVIFPGFLVYKSARKMFHKQCNQVNLESKQSFTPYYFIITFGIITPFLWSIFFKSNLFASPIGQHGFTILMGLCFAQIPVLGFGLLNSVDNDILEKLGNNV